MSSEIPDWRLPTGVGRSLWDYATAPHIARDYDEYFSTNSLFEYDQKILQEAFARPGRIVDLGAGTGRNLLKFAQAGYQAVAVDLSWPMLRVLGEKARALDVSVERIRANIVQLDGLADGMADYCISMFSTLGMIHGRKNRQTTLQHARRILKPDGLLAIHAHNRWYNLRIPGGMRAELQNLWRSFRGVEEPGDRVFDYRGIPKVRLHLFKRRELLHAIRSAGFRIVRCLPLNDERCAPLPRAWLGSNWRANGWIVIAQRSE